MLHYRSLVTGFCLLLAAFLFGCSASKNVTKTQTRLQGIEDARAANVDSLSTFLEKYRKNKEDEVLYRLEYGMLHHYRMDWENSAQHFQKADRAIEQQYTKDVSKNLKSLITNDLQLPYKGEPYESIYVSTFNSLNYLNQGDIKGGLVEVRRISHKLELLNDRYKGVANSLMHNKESEAEEDTSDRGRAMSAVGKVDKKIGDVDLLSRDDDQPVEVQQNSALGRFMATVLHAKTGSEDNARIALENLRTALEDQGNTGFLATFPDKGEGPSQASSASGPSAPASTATPSSDSAAVQLPAESQLTSDDAYNALLLAFSGTPPRKREKSYDFELEINGDQVELHFAVPRLETQGTQVDRVRALVAGDTLQVPLVENMQSVAKSMFERKLPLLYTRAIMRSVLKAGATEGAEAVAEDQFGAVGGFLAEQAGEAASKGLAQADTRAWQTLPGFAHGTVAKVPPGEHRVTFEYLPAKDARETRIHVMKEDGRWVVTTAGIDLVDEIDDIAEIDDISEIDELNQDEVDEDDFLRSYSTRRDAVDAGHRRARNHVPSTLILHSGDDSVQKTKEFELFKRRQRTISVSGDKDLGVAESLYLN